MKTGKVTGGYPVVCCGCSRSVNAVFSSCCCYESDGPSELGVMGQSTHRYVVFCKVMYGLRQLELVCASVPVW